MTVVQNLPQPFGKYLLLAAFAQGGMGQVYLAKYTTSAHKSAFCVLKKLRQDIELKPEYVRRFIDEARLVIQLDHEKIGHVFDVGRVKNEFFLAMEYISGVNLRKLLNRSLTRGQALPSLVSLYILREMLLALDYAHQAKHPVTGKELHLVHRDVSPQNVMLDFAGQVKLIDFGLALSDLKEEQTESQVVMGKLAYMSPEQARGDEMSPKSDQYSAAIVAYELVAGKRFYGGMGHHAIWQVVGRGTHRPSDLQEFAPELQMIFQQALHENPDKRFLSCADFAKKVEAYLQTSIENASVLKSSAAELMQSFFYREQAAEKELLARFQDIEAPEVQEKIVDVMGSLDLKMRSLDEKVTALTGASSEMRASWFKKGAGEHRLFKKGFMLFLIVLGAALLGYEITSYLR